MIFGLVDPQGLIVNTFGFDNEPELYPAPAGHTVVRVDNVENCGIGWSYINGTFIEPEQPAPPEEPPTALT